MGAGRWSGKECRYWQGVSKVCLEDLGWKDEEAESMLEGCRRWEVRG